MEKTRERKKRRLNIHTMLPGILLAFTLFVFAPVDLFYANADELWFSLTDLIPGLLGLAVLAFVLVTLLSCVLPAKLSVAFRAAVYAGAFLLWLQGNVLVTDYGTLNGELVDWAAFRTPGILDALLWAVVIGLFIFLMFRLKKKFRRAAEIAACILLVMQAVTIGFLVAQHTGNHQQGDRFLSRKDEFTVSPEENTIVFILDCFDGNLMTQLLEEYPEETAGSLQDFTFYPDTVAGAARTKYAIPFILTGDTNKEEQSYVEYLSRNYAASPLMQELAKGKYSTGFYTVRQYVDLARDDAIDNINPGTPRVRSRLGLTKQFMKLVAFRYAPTLLQRYFWMYTGDFEFWKRTDGDDTAYGLDDALFYRQLTGNRLSATAAEPCFRFYHLTGPHGPYIFDRNMERIGENASTEEEQALASLHVVKEYLDQLKELGLYDQATVFVMADHGYWKHSNVEHCPLFMVKLSGQAHPFEVSEMPFSYASLAEILTQAAKGELESLENWRATGERYFYSQSENENVVNLTEFVIGSPGLGQDVKETGTVYHEDTLHRSRAYTPGTVLYFDSRDTARGCMVSGFFANEGYYTWTKEYDAEMFFELPKEPGGLELVMEHGTHGDSQTVEVWVNDKLIDTYISTGTDRHTITIPAGTVTGTELRLRLHLPDAISPKDAGTGEDGRVLGLSMVSIVINEK